MEPKKKREESGKIKALIFDMGNVVAFYDNMLAARKMSKIINAPAKKIFKIIDGPAEKFTDAYELGAPSKVYWDIAAKKLGVEKIPYKKFDKLWVKIFNPNREMIFLIKKLRKNYKTALLSNTGRIHKEYLSKKYKFHNLFHVEIFSFKVKARKPNKEIYLLALKKLKVKPNEAVFIDDRIECVEGAEKVGIHGIHFKNNKQFLREIRKLGVEIKWTSKNS